MDEYAERAMLTYLIADTVRLMYPDGSQAATWSKVVRLTGGGAPIDGLRRTLVSLFMDRIDPDPGHVETVA